MELEESPALGVPAPPEVIGWLSQSLDLFRQMGEFVFGALHEFVSSKPLSMWMSLEIYASNSR
jgi:hypothetical protein